MKYKIVRAKLNHLHDIGILFDLYRQFYSYKSDISSSENYIKERLEKKRISNFYCNR